METSAPPPQERSSGWPPEAWRRRRRAAVFLKTLPSTFPVLFGAAFAFCLLGRILPAAAVWAGFAWLLLVLGALLFALATASRRVPPEVLLREVDRSLGTADLALTASDPGVDRHWRRILRNRLEPSLRELDMRRVWPARWTRRQKIWLAGAALMGSTIWLGAAAWGTGGAPAPGPVRAEETSALEEILADWEEAAEHVEAEEFQAAFAELEDLRESSDLAEHSPEERMEWLARAEALLEKHRAAANSESIAGHAGALSDLLEAAEGLSGAAAALRRGDFEEAAAALREETAAGAAPPEGARAEAVRSASEALGEEARREGRNDLADALDRMSGAAAEGDAREWREGSEDLAACFSRQSARDKALRMMRAQMAQLDARRMSLAGLEASEAPSLQSLLASSEGSPGDQPGEGIGSSPGSDPLGPATDPLAATETLSLAGAPGEGDSTTEVLRSTEGTEEDGGPMRVASPEEYQRLSTQAVRDESLPSAHRETIRRYFEAIRPRTTEP
ncbi:MAG: hypothetical protein ACLFTU_05900 [Puniceicoccaceae bacterium]